MESNGMRGGGIPEAGSEGGIIVRPRLGRDFFARDGITVARELLGKILVHETKIGRVRGIITEVESYMGEEDKGSHTYGGRRTERTEPMYHAGGTSYVYLIYGMYSCMNIAAMSEGIPQAVLLRSVIPADGESERRMIQLRQEAAAGRRRRTEAGKDGNSGKTEAGKDGNSGRTGDGKDGNSGKTGDGKDGNSGKAEEGKEEEGMAGKTDKTDTIGEAKLPSFGKHLADGPGRLCIAMGISRADNDVDMTESDSFYVTEGIRVEDAQIREARRIGIDYAEEAAEYLWRFYIEKGNDR